MDLSGAWWTDEFSKCLRLVQRKQWFHIRFFVQSVKGLQSLRWRHHCPLFRGILGASWCYDVSSQVGHHSHSMGYGCKSLSSTSHSGSRWGHSGPCRHSWEGTCASIASDWGSNLQAHPCPPPVTTIWSPAPALFLPQGRNASALVFVYWPVVEELQIFAFSQPIGPGAHLISKRHFFQVGLVWYSVGGGEELSFTSTQWGF